MEVAESSKRTTVAKHVWTNMSFKHSQSLAATKTAETCKVVRIDERSKHCEQGILSAHRPNNVSVWMERVRSSISSKLEKLRPESSASIFKVPTYLRDVRGKAYDPQVVSIGPYHPPENHDKYKEMEELKLRIFKSVRRDTEMEAYMISEVAAMEKEARDCYAEPIELDEAEFIEMLVLDGCFIIEVTSPCGIETLFAFRSHINQVIHDLMLLENQIPWFVLCKLFDIMEGRDQHHKLMQRIQNLCHKAIPGGLALHPPRDTHVKHILNLVHLCWNPNLNPINRHPKRDYHRCWKPKTTSPQDTDYDIIPTATELRNANVRFRKKEYKNGITPFDVEFNKGMMRMPTLAVDDCTESLMRNLIAYEQYLPPDEPAYVTDYAIFLDNLINSARDVELLCRRDIIKNMMGDNQAIVDIVNHLVESVPVTNEFRYEKMFRHINAHYKKRSNRAMAVLRRDYFNSPWALVSFFAALLLLLLTMAQTILTAL